jgi:AcrR family transcriptional regulator
MPAPSTPPDLRAAKRRVVAEALWYAAIELFGSQGFAGTTIEQIAERAGVSRRTFFRYFSSKEDIVVFGADAYGDLIVQAIDESEVARTPIEIVRAAVLRVADFVVAQPNAREAMRITHENPEVKAAQLSRLNQVETQVGAAYRRALGVRDLHHPSVTALAATTLMLVDVTLRTWYRNGAVPIERTVNDLIEAIRTLGDERPAGLRHGRGSRR